MTLLFLAATNLLSVPAHADELIAHWSAQVVFDIDDSVTASGELELMLVYDEDADQHYSYLGVYDTDVAFLQALEGSFGGWTECHCQPCALPTVVAAVLEQAPVHQGEGTEVGRLEHPPAEENGIQLGQAVWEQFIDGELVGFVFTQPDSDLDGDFVIFRPDLEDFVFKEAIGQMSHFDWMPIDVAETPPVDR